jgi:hypothetical protein
MRLIFLSIFLYYQLPTDNSAMTREFYKAFSFGNLNQIDSIIKVLDVDTTLKFHNAYKGAIMMKKSFLLKSPEAKLKSYKAGNKLLEKEIANSPKNTEYRFLRLVVQERAPEFLKYNKNITDDKAMVIKNFKELDSIVRDFILQYSKVSSVLKTNEIDSL